MRKRMPLQKRPEDVEGACGGPPTHTQTDREDRAVESTRDLKTPNKDFCMMWSDLCHFAVACCMHALVPAILTFILGSQPGAEEPVGIPAEPCGAGGPGAEGASAVDTKRYHVYVHVCTCVCMYVCVCVCVSLCVCVLMHTGVEGSEGAM